MPEIQPVVKRVSGRPGDASPYQGEADYLRALSRGASGSVDDPTLGEMKKNRRINSRTAVSSGGGGAISFATGRPQDPMFYWKQNNLPFDYSKAEELIKIRKYCRVIYATHPVIASAIDVYCLAAETKVITRDGVKPISALSGEVIGVLTKGGKWTDAKFDLMGEDHLRKVTLSRYGVTKTIFATPTHRWFTEKKVYRKNQILGEEVITDDLREGMELVTTTPWRNELKRTNPSPFGVAHGFVVGDGHRESNGGCMADLHGEKDLAVLPYFNGANTHVYEMLDGPTTRVVGLPGYFKDLPSLQESAAYLSGWLSGYFLADGTVSPKGQCFLDSVNLANLEFVRDVCTRLGVVTYPIYDIGEREVTAPDGTTRMLHMHRINIDSFDLRSDFFIGEEHRRRWDTAIGGRDRGLRRSNWRVVSVEETDRFEPVYCAVVPDTEAFVLEDFILTGNSKYPLTGMEIQCKDDALTEFYTSLFFDQLNYEEFLVDLGREYWTVGEAWPLGSFNETLGVWEDDELLNPDDVDVIRSPFLKEPRFEMRLPENLRNIIDKREPKWEFDALMRSYPELKNFIGYEARMPVSNVLLKQLKFKVDTFSSRGLPILMRGFRAIMQEEMLNAAQDAVASRLYTPLILAKLGASATDLGTTQPWIPTDDDLADFEESLDAALSGDFRVLTHHFAVKMDTVFGRENMPNMDADFDRLIDRQLQVFGLSRTMLTGAGAGETYAADAINRDVVSQLLTSHQRNIKRFFYDRAVVVAEAQEHFDYEERGGKRYVIMEEVLEVDEESGEQRIVEQPKLLVPDLQIKAMTMRDEADQRQFFEALRASGIPISMKSRMVNVPLDLDDEIQRTREEQIAQAIEAQVTRKETFLALDSAGLPIPEDLEADFRARAQGAKDQKAEEQVIPTIGTSEPADTAALAPTPEDIAAMENQDPNGGNMAPVIPLPTNKALNPPPERSRPPESDEQRARMPKPASRVTEPYRLRTVAEKTIEDPDAEGGERIVMEESWAEVDELDVAEGPNRLISGPRHIGARRYAGVSKDIPMDEQGLGG